LQAAASRLDVTANTPAAAIRAVVRPVGDAVRRRAPKLEISNRQNVIARIPYLTILVPMTAYRVPGDHAVCVRTRRSPPGPENIGEINGRWRISGTCLNH
jgi:hypothetical protein